MDNKWNVIGHINDILHNKTVYEQHEICKSLVQDAYDQLSKLEDDPEIYPYMNLVLLFELDMFRAQLEHEGLTEEIINNIRRTSSVDSLQQSKSLESISE